MYKNLTAKNIKKTFRNLPVFWKLIPFLILYITISLVFGHREPAGDENRYLFFANNLLNGFYSPPPPEISLWNGPGYPLLVAAALFLGANKMLLSVVNAILFFGSLLFIQKSISLFTKKNNAFIYTVLAGLYLPMWFYIPLVLTEVFVWFLISVISFLFLRIRTDQSVFSLNTIMLAASVACLMLTKVIFAYAVLAILPAALLFMFSRSYNNEAKKILTAAILALILCLPYLFYTYSITGKLFYWSNSGSMSLYTMSTPESGEFGDWKGANVLKSKPYHKEFMDSVLVLTPLERDDAYMEKAVENIRENPGKYVLNWVANVNRLLFSFPLEDQSVMRTYYSIFKLLPQATVVILILLTLSVGFIKWRQIPGEMLLLVIFMLIYLGGSSLLSAVERMFYITIPVWTIYMAYIFEKIITVNIAYRK